MHPHSPSPYRHSSIWRRVHLASRVHLEPRVHLVPRTDFATRGSAHLEPRTHLELRARLEPRVHLVRMARILLHPVNCERFPQHLAHPAGGTRPARCIVRLAPAQSFPRPRSLRHIPGSVRQIPDSRHSFLETLQRDSWVIVRKYGREVLPCGAAGAHAHLAHSDSVPETLALDFPFLLVVLYPEE